MAYYATRQVLDDLEQIRATLQEASEVMADFQDVREFENMHCRDQALAPCGADARYRLNNAATWMS